MNVRMASSPFACQIKFSTIADLTMNGSVYCDKILSFIEPSHGRDIMITILQTAFCRYNTFVWKQKSYDRGIRSRPPSEILDSNPPSGINSHRRPENDINNNVGQSIYCEGNDSPVQSERRSPSPELEQTASPELELRSSSRCRKKPQYLHEYEMG
ncbi:hypothetical protein GJ496_011014 [Pomphorhynchus laevis]|nr:hypothetical protein GJ496_011014 [Pomphorhynchus laevis]